MRKFAYLFVVLTFTACAGDEASSWKALEQPLNFYIVNDAGRNGYYEQKPIAQTMGRMAETIDIEFVVGAGDIHHFEGVRSVSDPLWMTNYELIYSHPDLMIPWYPICGNHEYRGNTEAVVDYSSVSARWNMPSKYYTFTAEEDGVTVRIIMLDTTPLIEKYRKDTEDYPDASLEPAEPQLEWLDSTLAAANEDWIIVVGHHPIYAQTHKNESERLDLQKRIDSIIRSRGNVDFYVCGHIHNFQHIRMEGSSTDYIVNSSASLARDVAPTQGTVFCSPEEGWSLVTVSPTALTLYMLDSAGKVLHRIDRRK